MTLSLEASISVRDWSSANALLASRQELIATLTTEEAQGIDDVIKLDAKLQKNLEMHMNGLRSRIQGVSHARRTTSAFQAARNGKSRFDLTG